MAAASHRHCACHRAAVAAVGAAGAAVAADDNWLAVALKRKMSDAAGVVAAAASAVRVREERASSKLSTADEE